VTIDTGTLVILSRPGITAGLSKRELTLPYFPQMAPGETLPILMEALVEMTQEQSPQQIWAFVVEITDKFMLGLDVLHPQCVCGFRGGGWAMCYDWAREKCHCGILGHERVLPST
jgi:hypothetical protein